MAGLLAFAALSFAAPAAHADGNTFPYHENAGFGCTSSRSLQTTPPAQMVSWTGGENEEVAWRAYLYRYNYSTQTWEYTQRASNWAFAAAGRNGLYTMYIVGAPYRWTDKRMYTGNVYMWAPFHNLEPGYYAVVEQYYWYASGQSHFQWQTDRGRNYGTNSYYCEIR